MFEWIENLFCPDDDEAWNDYVNSLAMAEVLFQLEIHDEPWTYD